MTREIRTFPPRMSPPWRPQLSRKLHHALWWGALLAAGLSARAEAIPCLSAPDPTVRPLQEQLTHDPASILKQTRNAIESLQRSPQPNAPRLAALYAVEAQGYSLLELDGQARAVASQGLELAKDVHDPVHLDLLSAYAENIYDQAGIASAVHSIESARAAQTAGSLADTCLLITLGRLQYR